MNREKSRWTMRAVVSIVTLLAVQGCAAIVDPQPFERLHETTVAFQSATDDAMGAVYDFAEKDFARSSPFGDEVGFDQLVLTWEEDGDPTRPRPEAEALHVMVRQLRHDCWDVNEALGEYTRFLLVLAGGSANDAERLEELGRSANSHLRSARTGLGLPDDDEGTALVATAGTELLRQKIEKDRRVHLREVMTEAGPAVKAVSSLMVTTMYLAAGDVETAYLRRAEELRREHESAGPEDRRGILETLLAHNERTLLLLDSLRAVREGYLELPQAHAEVLAGLDRKEPVLVAIRRLSDDVDRLQKLRDELAAAADE